MARLKRTTLVGFIWLTAVAVSLAGLPRFSCHCPNGDSRSLCLGSTTSTSSCCCGGGCCNTDEGSPSCCHSQEPPLSPPEDELPSCCRDAVSAISSEAAPTQATSTGCQRILAETEPTTTETRSLIVLEDQAASAELLPVALVDLSSWLDHRHALWEAHLRAPPPDLIVLLRHFII